MRASWARRLIAMCVPAATVVALAAPGAAHAELLLQCEGANILGRGSTFQGAIPQDSIWNPGFNTSTNNTACSGTQGVALKPTVEYLQVAEEDRGSGACLKAFGVGVPVAKFDRYTYCGTDEAPNEAQKNEIESFASGAETRSLETIPMLQGAVAVPIHLPAGCVASAEYKEGEKTIKPGRLVLNDETLEKIFRGEITTWGKITDGGDKIIAEKGKTCTAESPITVVVRKDKSGTTHIFKEFLASTNRLGAAGEENGKAEVKWLEKPGTELTWKEAASGSNNPEWPEAAKVVRPAENGGPALVTKVAETPGSIGYADLGDTFKNGSFDQKALGGGEKQNKFWPMIERKTVAPILYADPASKKDTEIAGNANCSKTVYTNGEVAFPPSSTRELWNAAQAQLNETTYSLCGLSYDLTFRQYGKYHDEKGGIGAGPTEAQATTAENYLLYEVNSATAGGGKVIGESHEFEKLPSSLLKEVETGIKEIGYEKSGVKFTCVKEATEGTGTLFYKSLKECETLNAPGSKGFYKR